MHTSGAGATPPKAIAPPKSIFLQLRSQAISGSSEFGHRIAPQTLPGSTKATRATKTMEPNYGATDDEANTPLMEDSGLLTEKPVRRGRAVAVAAVIGTTLMAATATTTQRYADLRASLRTPRGTPSVDWVYDLTVLPQCCDFPSCGGAFTPSTRLVSRNDGSGWFLFRFRGGSDRETSPRVA